MKVFIKSLLLLMALGLVGSALALSGIINFDFSTFEKWKATLWGETIQMDRRVAMSGDPHGLYVTAYREIDEAVALSSTDPYAALSVLRKYDGFVERMIETYPESDVSVLLLQTGRIGTYEWTELERLRERLEYLLHLATEPFALLDQMAPLIEDRRERLFASIAVEKLRVGWDAEANYSRERVEAIVRDWEQSGEELDFQALLQLSEVCLLGGDLEYARALAGSDQRGELEQLTGRLVLLQNGFCREDSDVAFDDELFDVGVQIMTREDLYERASLLLGLVPVFQVQDKRRDIEEALTRCLGIAYREADPWRRQYLEARIGALALASGVEDIGNAVRERLAGSIAKVDWSHVEQSNVPTLAGWVLPHPSERDIAGALAALESDKWLTELTEQMGKLDFKAEGGSVHGFSVAVAWLCSKIRANDGLESLEKSPVMIGLAQLVVGEIEKNENFEEKV